MSSSICIFTHHYHPQLSGIGNFVDGLAHALAAAATGWLSLLMIQCA